MTTLVHDLRLAVRVLLGTKSWTLVVLLSLALGIGANTPLFRFTRFSDEPASREIQQERRPT